MLPEPRNHSKDASINVFVAISDKAPNPKSQSKAIYAPQRHVHRAPADFVSPFNATVVDLLQASGAQVIGKTNCDEFGMGSLNVDSVHGPVVNPFQLPWETRERRSAGGSSGGSAAAVAAGLCDVCVSLTCPSAPAHLPQCIRYRYRRFRPSPSSILWRRWLKTIVWPAQSMGHRSLRG